jgi:hypothetical protein
MSAFGSAYYPPRAGWLTRHLLGWHRLRRVLQLERLAPPPTAASWVQFAVWMLVPGAVCFARRQIWCGFGLLGTWLLSMTVFWLWIGMTASGWAFVVLTGVHSLSANMALTWALVPRLGSNRMLRMSLGGFVFILVFYGVFRAQIVDRVVRPLTVGKTSMLMRPLTPTSAIARGEWLAYQIPQPGHYFIRGLGLDRVLALPGETVRFGPESFEVNGVAYRRIASEMPVVGEWTIPNDSYFIWPTSLNRPDLAFEVAIVNRQLIAGTPYHRWFWRRQDLAPLEVYERLGNSRHQSNAGEVLR